MANKIKIHHGDVDDIYEPTDSENEYTEHEKSLLNKVRKGRQRNADPEQEILAFRQDDDTDEDDQDDQDDFDKKFEADSDLEDVGDDGIPDSRAWGKQRKDFYNTDFVDQDYSSYNQREEDLAEQEEAEARAIQQRLAKQFDEADFTLDIFGGATAETPAKDKKKKKVVEEQKTYLKSDLSELSQRQKAQLFKKDSPEFEGLVQDFQQRLEESRNILEPILEYFKQISLAEHPLVEFVVTKNNLILNYCSNVAFYLVLKAKRASIKNHPIVKRLVQMRQLLIQLEEKYVEVIKPQLESLLSDIREGKEIEITAEVAKKPVTTGKQRKKLGFVKSMDQDQDAKDEEDEQEEVASDDEDLSKTFADKLAGSDSDEAPDQDMEGDEELGDDEDRREITYQMKKNKGLTPFRKKELRNPRVKHRNKYRKALIRRKGAVRTVRKETKRYDGEKFGIKASVKKGIKIK